MFESLQTLLSTDPAMVAVFSGLSMMIVQMLKSSLPFVDRNPRLYVLILALFFATMIVYEIQSVLGIAVMTFLIMSSASGIYSSSKSETVVELPDYSDES